MKRGARIPSQAGAFALATVLLAWPGGAAAQCSYTILTSSYPVTANSTVQYYALSQYNGYWAAIGVRPDAAGEDWDISVWQNTAPSPDCVSGMLMNSEQYGSQMDFVIGDFNHNPIGSYWIAARRWDGSGSGKVEWHGGSDQLAVGAARVEKSLGPSDMIQVYDVNLAAGTTYSFHFSTQGPADIHYFVFENVGGEAYWGNRAGAALQGDRCAAYTPTVSGWHGVAVVCDFGEGTYELGVTQGACGCPAELADGVPMDIGAATNLLSVAPTQNSWSAAVIRYDGELPACMLTAFSEPYGSPAPDCLSGELAVDNTYAPIQALAADFNWNPLQAFYLQAYCETDVKIEWAQSSGVLFVNDEPAVVDYGPGDVVDVYEIGLQAGHTYTCSISSWSNWPQLRIYGPTTGTLFSTGPLVQTSETASFTATTSGYYGVVVINADAGSGSCEVSVRECRSITALASGTPRVVYGDEDLFSFTQAQVYWAAVGVRDLTLDFEVSAYTALGPGPHPYCLSGSVAGSLEMPPEVDYVIADFNHTSLSKYYAKAFSWGEFSFSGDTWIEWDDGTDQVQTNGTAVQRTWTAGDVIDVYDVLLEAGRTYAFYLDASGLSARLDLFKSSAATYWGNVGNREWTVGAGGSYTYTCPTTDWYGVVVVHQDMNPGTYDLRVYPRGVSVEEGPALVTGLTSLEPNPARGLLRVQYALGERSRVGFRVLDVGGREVWRREAEMRDAGRWGLEWAWSGADGRQLAPGLYFLHMTVNDRPVALRKVTLLR